MGESCSAGGQTPADVNTRVETRADEAPLLPSRLCFRLFIGPRHPLGQQPLQSNAALGMTRVSILVAGLTGGGARHRAARMQLGSGRRGDGRLDVAPVGVSLAVS